MTDDIRGAATPKPGDKVRVQGRAMEGLLAEFDGDVGVLVEEDGKTRVFKVPFCSVEVLEPAYDPSGNPVGTVRQNANGVVVAKPYGAIGWKVIWDCGATDRDYYADDEVVGWPVTGSVPGTPAAADDPAEFIREITKANRWAGESDADYQARMIRDGVAHVAQEPKPNLSGSDQVHTGRVEDCEHDWCQTGEVRS